MSVQQLLGSLFTSQNSHVDRLAKEVLESVEDMETAVLLLLVYAKTGRITQIKEKAVIEGLVRTQEGLVKTQEGLVKTQEDLAVSEGTVNKLEDFVYGNKGMCTTNSRTLYKTNLEKQLFFVHNHWDMYFGELASSVRKESAWDQALLKLCNSWREKHSRTPYTELDSFGDEVNEFTKLSSDVRQHAKYKVKLSYTLPLELVKKINSVQVDKSLSHVHPKYVPGQRTQRFARVLNQIQ